MELIIDRDEVNIKFGIDDKKQRDLSIYEEDNIGIIVYGYPYTVKNPHWIKAVDVYSLYKVDGEKFVDSIDGSYAVLYFDKRKKIIKAITDPYKIYTFYINESEDEVVISNSLSQLTTNRSLINEMAVLEFLHFGFVIGDKTIFNNINTVPSGTILTIESDLNVDKKAYFDYSLNEDAVASREDFKNEFNNHVEAANSLSDSISLPLTGGIDSRTILSSCLGFKDKLHCYTHGLSDSEDVKIAKKISRTLNLKHSHYNELDDDFIKDIPNISKRLTNNFEGMLNSILFSHLEISYRNEAEFSDTFLTGIAGEMARYYYLPADYDYTGIYNLSADLKNRLLVNKDLGIYSSKTDSASDTLINSIKQELESYNSDDPDYLINLFYLKNRIGNFGAFTARYLGKTFNVFNPYLSKKLVKIMLNLNEIDKKDGVQKFVITSNNESLSNIPVSGGRFIRNNLKNITYNKFNKCKTYTKKAVNKVMKKSVFNFEYVNYRNWLRNNLKDFIETELKYDELRVKENVDAIKYNKYLNEYLIGKLNITYQLTNLLSLQLFFKKIQSTSIAERSNKRF